jgi:hypothetical protein
MSEAELRAMVREVLGEVLKDRRPQNIGAAAPVSEPVSIGDDRELAAFVTRLIARLDDPATGQAIRTGRLAFALTKAGNVQSPSGRAPSRSSQSGAAVELTGVITEAKVARLAGAGRLVLAPTAVMTPLARDRARALGLTIERKR